MGGWNPVDEQPEKYRGESHKYVRFQAKSTRLFRNCIVDGNYCRKSGHRNEQVREIRYLFPDDEYPKKKNSGF
jgi:hypothetical protein